MVEVLDQLGIRDNLNVYMAATLKRRADCGIWRLVTLHKLLKVNVKNEGNLRMHKAGLGVNKIRERELQGLSKGALHRKIWDEFVRGQRSRFYEMCANERQP